MISSVLVLPSMQSLSLQLQRVLTNSPSKKLHSLFATAKPVPLFTNEILDLPGHLPLLPTSHPSYRCSWADYSVRPFNNFYKNLCRPKECFHDEKFDCELWRRLRDWMPNNTRYCHSCRRFTRRDKRRRKGACESNCYCLYIQCH